MTNELAANQVFDSAFRLERVADLRQALGLQALEPEPSLTTGVPDAPSIGIEIEVLWWQAFPELGRQWANAPLRPNQLDRASSEYQLFHQAYDTADTLLRPKLEQVESVIPRVGHDAYWEFSFRPSKDLRVTTAELQTLYDATLLRAGESYATHMTIAGHASRRDAFALLCALELSGGSTPNRIMAAATAAKGSWARKGSGGLQARRSHELVGPHGVGYEYRTLVTSSFSQITRLLHTARRLADMMLRGDDDWQDYRQDIEAKLQNAGLQLTGWPKPQVDPETWRRYTTLFSNALPKIPTAGYESAV